jgi:hypothetical protein
MTGPESHLPDVRRPVRPGAYEVKARSRKVAAAWQELTNQAPGEGQRVYDQLASDPLRDDGDRQHPLEGNAGVGAFDGATYTRWQIDITSGGRIWYFVDQRETGAKNNSRAGTVIIDQVHAGHPKSTESKPTGKRRPGRR